MFSATHRPHADTARNGLTILELLVATGAISTLVALLVPALGSARETARSAECVNRLRLTGVAIHAHHDQHGHLPAGWTRNSLHHSAYGWAMELLPFMEQRRLYEQISRDRPLNDQIGVELLLARLPVLECPSDVFEPTFVMYKAGANHGPGVPLIELPSASFVGVFGTVEADDGPYAPPGDGVFLEDRPLQLKDIARGQSNTLFVGERTAARVPSTWPGVDSRGEDAACRLVGTAFTRPNCRFCDECEFGSRHPGGSHFLWGDGRVTRVSENIDTEEYRMLARRSAESYRAESRSAETPGIRAAAGGVER